VDSVITPGDTAPDFSLIDLAGGTHQLADERGRVVVLNFWSAICPWSLRADDDVAKLFHEWQPRVTYWLIGSNADETIDVMRSAATERSLGVVLRDDEQSVANWYGAVATPQFFVIDAQGLVRYSGALDDVTFRNRTPSRAYLAEAVESVFEGRLPDPAMTPAYGCSLVRFTPVENQFSG
jgi:peroxiredoxin